MIILKGIVCEYLESVQVELPRANMVIDPRVNDSHYCERFQCEYHDNGTTVTLTNTDNNYSGFSGSGTNTDDETFRFRVYDPATETVPSFDSTIYTYMGEDDEFAPHDTTILIIHPSVTVIKEYAFGCCEEIKKCYMHDGVHTIEATAFTCCEAMKTIRLSRSLTQIRERAFSQCSSLEAVFLPPTVNQIDEYAFERCEELRILPLPIDIDISQIKEKILGDSYDFFETTQISYSVYDDYDYDGNNVYQKIVHFYRDQVPPLHKVCLRTHVTHETIQECINTHGRATASITDHDGMTPLHILAMNPHADISAILACFHLDMSSVFVEDHRGNTPLDHLRVHHDSIEDHTSLVSSLCMHRYAAASSQDDQDTSAKKRKRSNE